MVLDQLSSQRGERDQAANRALAARCLAEPELLSGIVAGLASPEPAIVADCAGVLSIVATANPALVAPVGDAVVPLTSDKTSAIRWQAMQVVASIAALRPDLIAPLLPHLEQTIRTDRSMIARDKATEAIAAFAGTSRAAANVAAPMLISILPIEQGRFASRALDGLRQALAADPTLADRLLPIAGQHLDHHRGVARTAARRLLKAAEAADSR